MWHAWGRGEVFTEFGLGGPKVGDHWEDQGVGGRITLSWNLDTDQWDELHSADSG
jgi:hypothetical protein